MVENEKQILSKPLYIQTNQLSFQQGYQKIKRDHELDKIYEKLKIS